MQMHIEQNLQNPTTEPDVKKEKRLTKKPNSVDLEDLLPVFPFRSFYNYFFFHYLTNNALYQLYSPPS